MCAQGMEWDLLYALQISKARTFEGLTTKAHDMEMTITNCHNKSSSSYEFKNDRGYSKKSSKPPKTSTKETMIVFTREPMRIFGKSMPKGNNASSSKELTKKRPTLKEPQERKYSFPD